MSNPLTPDERQEKPEGEAVKESSEGQASLSFKDVLPLEVRPAARVGGTVSEIFSYDVNV